MEHTLPEEGGYAQGHTSPRCMLSAELCILCNLPILLFKGKISGLHVSPVL